MTEPIKLPPIPYAPVHMPSMWDGKLPEYREAHMRGYAIIAVEQATAEMKAENDLLGSAADKLRVMWRQEVHQLMQDKDHLRAENEALREALQMAVRQNEHDMLMTGDECREARAALAKEPK
jgi:hypothetical protein